MMINSAILLLLLHYSLLNAQSRSRTHDIKKQTTHHEKEKRETFFPRKRKHQLTKSTKSLSLSLSPCRWSPSLFLCQKLFFIQKFRRECVETWQPKNIKISLLSSHSCFLVCFLEPRDRENSCLESLLFSRERTLSPSLKSCLPPRE